MNNLLQEQKGLLIERLRCKDLTEKIMSAEDAAKLIKDGMVIATSGFTPAGYPKAVPLALAKRVENGDKVRITLITGASVGDELDGALSRAGVIKRRYPYQTNKSMREAINSGEVEYADIHLSNVPVWIKNGYFGNIDLAIVEAVEIDEDGNIIPSTSVGCTNVAIEYADKVIVEINTAQPIGLKGIHDIYSPKKAPNTEPIPIVNVEDRIGTSYIKCDKNKIVAIVQSDIPDGSRKTGPYDEDSKRIAKNLIGLLKNEVEKGRMSIHLMPIQSGVGNVANAVLNGLKYSDFSHLTIYSEVLQDSVLDLIDVGKVDFASSTSLTLSPDIAKYFNSNIDRYRDKIVLRPEEISNSPEVVRRLGVIAINTAIEADIYGNVNSTHINGTKMMNGIGGSGDFARNALLSIFTTVSTAKNGALSSIVPFVSHVDHTEHDVHVIITEQGVADLRGLSPKERALQIINNCVHPNFKDEMMRYYEKSIKQSKYKHTPYI